jgi:hypothetical protein
MRNLRQSGNVRAKNKAGKNLIRCFIIKSPAMCKKNPIRVFMTKSQLSTYPGKLKKPFVRLRAGFRANGSLR